MGRPLGFGIEPHAGHPGQAGLNLQDMLPELDLALPTTASEAAFSLSRWANWLSAPDPM